MSERYYKAFYSCSEYESQGDYEDELKAIIPDNVSRKDSLELLNTAFTIIGIVALGAFVYITQKK